MSFTRSMYDSCAISQRDKDSTTPFNLITDASVHESNTSCRTKASPFMHSPGNSIPSDIVDLESRLRPFSRPLGNCISDNYVPQPKCTDCANCDASSPCDCLHCLTTTKHTNQIDCEGDEGIMPSYTRTKKTGNIVPAINRFDIVPGNPQEDFTIASNTIIGTNSRLYMRDAFDAQTEKDPRLDRVYGI